jgi:hypothetical protein
LKKLLLIGLPVVVLLAFVAGGAYLIFGQGKPPSQPTSFHLTNTTRDYNLVLGVAPMQKMYTPDQVKTQHPTDGEVMFAGTMVMPGSQGGSSSGGSMPGMDMSNMGSDAPGWHHLEVHIYSRASNDVIKDAHPVITVRDETTGKQTDLPIVTMQGIVAGPQDFHYGNNVYLPSGHGYTATVQLDADTATFHFKL